MVWDLLVQLHYLRDETLRLIVIKCLYFFIYLLSIDYVLGTGTQW